MRKEYARDFWSAYIKLITKKGSETSVKDPFLDFQREDRMGKYKNCSIYEKEDLQENAVELSIFWQGKIKNKVANIFIEALSRTSVCEDEIYAIAEILSEASKRTDYVSQHIEELRSKEEKDDAVPPVTPDDIVPDPEDVFPEPDDIEFDSDDPGFEEVYEETPFDDEEFWWTPKLIYRYLSERVYGQEEAKRGAATLLYNHLNGHRRNMLVAGPTGCGKTEIWRTLQVKFPFIKIINGPQLACDGWKGSYHVKDIFLSEKPEVRNHLLVVIDEADKLFEPMVGSNGTDFSRSIQNEFLKLIDGDEVTFVEDDKNRAIQTTVNCSNVSFVFCGSFETLRQNKEIKPSAIGFSRNSESEVSTPEITEEDLVLYGNVRREIAGRIDKIVMLQPLSADDFEQIMQSRKKMSPIRQLARQYDIDISLDRKTQRILAEKACESKLGCRYIRSRLQGMLDDRIFDDPDQKQYCLSMS